MGVFEAMTGEGGHEQVVFCKDDRAGLKAIIAIHDTTLGPALGGLRMWNYETEQDALTDVLRLSKGMTYKAAAAGLNLGGGKAVIIGDRKQKSEAMFRVFGRFVESLNGRYITAEDVGTTVHDMEYIFMETKYVTGVAPAHGGSGDPSPVTAFGVFQGMKAAAQHAFGSTSVAGKHVAVQGLGNVGKNLVGHLIENEATVTVCDIEQARIDWIQSKYEGVKVVDKDAIYGVDCDIFSPNALGAVINDDTITQLKCRVVCGGANNQLAEDRHGRELENRGILYAPDYVVNAGGLINVYVEMEGYVRERALRMAEGIYANTERVLNIAKEQGIPTFEAADRFAEERIDTIGQIKKGFFGGI